MQKHLPAELWIIVASMLSFNDLKSLTLTCNGFRSLLLPSVFRSVYFTVDQDHYVFTLLRTMWDLLRREYSRYQFYTSRFIAPWIHSVHLRANGPPSLSIDTIRLFLTLTSFPNLTSLSLTRIHLTQARICMLACLSNVRSLDMRSCSAEDLGKISLSSLPLRSFTIETTEPTPQVILNTQDLQHLSIKSGGWLPSLTINHSLSRLRFFHLSTSQSSLPVYLRFLKENECCSLEALVIDETNGPTSDSLPLDIFPSDVKYFDGQYTRVLSIAQKSLGNLQCLHMRCNRDTSGNDIAIFDILNKLANITPQLRTLKAKFKKLDHDHMWAICTFSFLEDLELGSDELQASVSLCQAKFKVFDLASFSPLWTR